MSIDASSALDIASHSLLQDYDMLIYFSYYTWGNPETIMPFGLQADPTQWGLFGYAGSVYLLAGIWNRTQNPLQLLIMT